MEQKQIKDVSSGLRDLYQRAVQSAQRNNVQYAIEQLREIVKKSPGFMPAREELRKLERQKMLSMGAIGKLIAKLKSSMFAAKITPLVKKRPLDAMKICEDALSVCLYNQVVLNLLADAALNADASFIAIESLELVREFSPGNEANLRKLAEVYKSENRGSEVVRIFQQIASKHPNDVTIQNELRSAVAMASMQKGQWEKEGSFQDKLKDKEEASALEREDNLVRDSEHIDELIERYSKELEEKDSIDLRKRLAELYLRGKYYDEAIATFEKVAEQLGAMDPTIDRQIEKAYVAKCDDAIATITADPGCVDEPEEQLKAWKAEKDNYRMQKALDRIKSYPNDAQLRYDLAMLYFEFGQIDEALEQFQHAKRNPQRRLSSIVYLGRCFQSKEQYDLAVEQFESAIAEMHAMDKQRKETLYYLGNAYECMGNGEKAQECFKELYQNDINFMDVADRIQKYYGK